MWIAVMGLMMLTGAVVREQGQGFDDFGWRRGQGGMEQAAANENSSGGAAVTVIAGPPLGTVSMSGGDEADASASTQSQLEGSWDLACESKRGNHMVFDRDSIRGEPTSASRRVTALGFRSARSGTRRWFGGQPPKPLPNRRTRSTPRSPIVTPRASKRTGRASARRRARARAGGI